MVLNAVAFNRVLGRWHSDKGERPGKIVSLEDVISQPDALGYAVLKDKSVQGAMDGCAEMGMIPLEDDIPLLAVIPPCPLAHLGDPLFCADHGIRYACYAGSMAHGIASEALVAAMSEAGMLGFFGSAGLSLPALEDTIVRLSQRLSGSPFGFNLINSPNDSLWEREAVALFLKHGIHLIEASAYLLPTPALVKFRVTGIHETAKGAVVAPNKIIAKVSRTEIAQRFLEPPSEKVLKKLVESGEIKSEEAQLAMKIPLAQDITAEADSGGHTDHRAALAMLPSLLRVRDAVQRQYGFATPPRVGLAGGIGTPEAAAAAFAMGAAYIVTGSVNQACRESGSSALVREMLAAAAQTDIADAPAADMFEMGVTVQVLKKGTRFAERASKLFELYKRYDSIEDIPKEQREKLEDTVFRASLDEIWEQTQSFFKERNPRQLEKAQTHPKHKMALIFRWYLGNAAHWAHCGLSERKEDFQIWCGPAMGAFNDWTRGSFLETVSERSAPVVALNLLRGAAVLSRLHALRMQGIRIPARSCWIAPCLGEDKNTGETV